MSSFGSGCGDCITETEHYLHAMVLLYLLCEFAHGFVHVVHVVQVMCVHIRGECLVLGSWVLLKFVLKKKNLNNKILFLQTPFVSTPVMKSPNSRFRTLKQGNSLSALSVMLHNIIFEKKKHW